MNTFEPVTSEPVVISNYPRKEELPVKMRLNYLADALSRSLLAFALPPLVYKYANEYLHRWIRSYPFSIHVTKLVIVLTLAIGLPLLWGVLKKIEAAQEWKRLKTVALFLLLGALMLPVREIAIFLAVFCLFKLRRAGIKLKFTFDVDHIRAQIDALESGAKNRQIQRENSAI